MKIFEVQSAVPKTGPNGNRSRKNEERESSSGSRGGMNSQDTKRPNTHIEEKLRSVEAA